MENPWFNLPDASPYVLPSDKLFVDAFNQRYQGNDRRSLRLDIKPEPYIGSLEAPILLLYLNPGYTADDVRLHQHPDGKELWWANIHQSLSDFPFYLLDPRIAWAPGAQWWRRKLKILCALAGDRTVSQNILCVEYFAYHSKKDPRFPGIVPSQEFGFHLVDRAIDRGALILIARSGRAWREQVSRLNDYRLAYQARSSQQGAISPGNYPEAFPHIGEILRSASMSR
jgi:hypothetical protein